MDIALREKITVTIAEASALTGIGSAKLAEWADTDDTFPVFRIGKKRVIEDGLIWNLTGNNLNKAGVNTIVFPIVLNVEIIVVEKLVAFILPPIIYRLSIVNGSV